MALSQFTIQAPRALESKNVNSFDELHAETKKRGEHNDCTVKALAVSMGISYGEAWSICALAGRKPRKGFPMEHGINRAKRHGYQFTLVTGNTPATVKQLHGHFNFLKGNYIINVRGHVLGMRDGKIIDWASHTSKRIIRVWKVEKIGG